DEGCGREHDGLAYLRFDSAQVLVMEEVAWKDLVDRDRPERRVVVIAQVFLLALHGPRGIDIGQIVVGARRLGFERPRRPHARERPAVEVGRGGDGDLFAAEQRDDRLTLEERGELVELLPSDLDKLAGFGMFGLCSSPGLERI